MKPLIIHPNAEEEIIVASKYYESKEISLGYKFLLEIELSLKRIQFTPSAWPEIIKRKRKYVLNRFPYVIFYEIEENRIFVLAVSHIKQKPYYWKNRR